MNFNEMDKEQNKKNDQLQDQILDFCRNLFESSDIVAVSLFDNCPTKTPVAGTAIQVVVVIRNFQPKLVSYVRVLGKRNLIIVGIDQWVFERDIERGFLGEAAVGMLVFPYKAIEGRSYLFEKELGLKRRLVLESLENLVLGFPELAEQIHIAPEYFMYEIIQSRVRVFPPLALCAFNLSRGPKGVHDSVMTGYSRVLKELEGQGIILFSGNFVKMSQKFILQSKNPRKRFESLAKNVQRSIFTAVFEVFPQLVNFIAQNTEAILRLEKLSLKLEVGENGYFVDAQKFLFVPMAKGLVSLANEVSMENYARKTLLKGRSGTVSFKRMGGVLNDVYLIKVKSSQDGEKRVLVKRFKDWSGFKWFPLSLWSFGARTFSVLGRSRLEKECAIGEVLHGAGFNVPEVLHVSHRERLIFMEFIEGENLSELVKRISRARSNEQCEKELGTIEKVGEIFAKVHALGVALGDTKPENVIINPIGDVYLLDFEQASRYGDKSWDIAEFLYFSGHYLPPLNSEAKAVSIASAFIRGYTKAGGQLRDVKGAAFARYTRVFSVFTMPSVILAMSNTCRKAKA